MKEGATLGGGCFWCLEAVFEEVIGVKKVISGYSGGSEINPTYEQVSQGNTNHAEVVHITFDNDLISFEELLHIFFGIHDPTTLNRQGNDVGTQYRSIIAFHNDKQKQIVDKVISDLQKSISKKIVTEVVPFDKFWKAENYHQGYFRNNPYQQYCQYVVYPKITKFKASFEKYVKKS
jgi:peptide-methionine (S)-S-oxide reductase